LQSTELRFAGSETWLQICALKLRLKNFHLKGTHRILSVTFSDVLATVKLPSFVYHCNHHQQPDIINEKGSDACADYVYFCPSQANPQNNMQLFTFVSEK
jgi:hypothetical protein